MRRIETTFASQWLERVMDAVRTLRVPHQMSASEVRFADRDTAHQEVYRGSTYMIPWQIRTRLEVFVGDKEASDVLDAILGAFDEDPRIDGVVVVSGIEEAIRIRTGQRGDYAL